MEAQQSQAASLRQQLRASTATWHDRVDGRIAPWLTRPTLPAYATVLRALHGFYCPLEAALARTSVEQYGLRTAERRKCGLIVADLESLDVDVASLPLCTDLPDTRTADAALGCHYVLEGSMLGGRVIARQIAGSLNLSAGAGLSFFTGYGPNTEAMWKAFLECLERAGEDGQRDTICAGAVDCFSCLDRWLERSLAAAPSWRD